MMKKFRLLTILAVSLLIAAGLAPWAAWSQAAGSIAEPKRGERQTPGEDAASPESRKQQLDAREAALAARELQLNALAGDLNNRTAELENARKKLALAQGEQKKLQTDRARKTLKIYRSMRPEESAKLLDKLDEGTATGILNALDQKTVMQMIPYLNQPRVLKWTRETLAGM